MSRQNSIFETDLFYTTYEEIKDNKRLKLIKNIIHKCVFADNRSVIYWIAYKQNLLDDWEEWKRGNCANT